VGGVSGDEHLIGVGDVLAVSTGNSAAAELIKIGEVLRGLDGLDNHVVVVHNKTGGRWFGIEGRPGGVGYAPIDKYLRNPRTVCNYAQPKTDAQRTRIAKRAEAMLGTAYDWRAIAAYAFRVLQIPLLYEANWRIPVPGTTSKDYRAGTPDHVVCSSYAAWLYAAEGLPHPSVGMERYCYPADWTRFIIDKVWAAVT
jgi:hypothetical protein